MANTAAPVVAATECEFEVFISTPAFGLCQSTARAAHPRWAAVPLRAQYQPRACPPVHTCDQQTHCIERQRHHQKRDRSTDRINEAAGHAWALRRHNIQRTELAGPVQLPTFRRLSGRSARRDGVHCRTTSRVHVCSNSGGIAQHALWRFLPRHATECNVCRGKALAERQS